MNQISVAIITKNEENNIERCLNSIKWADEIVVVDSGSVDKTVHICQAAKAKVILSDWLGFGKTKQFAVENCSNQWILVLDADEIITDELKNKIRKILENPHFSGYRIKRKSFYLKKMIQHCGWDKDYTLRLFDKEKGRFNDKIVHESVVIPDGKIGKIEEPILHYTYPTLASHFSKMISYASLGAQQDFNKGKNHP
jgi:glycosyltransferase involved in cell wall biosynthesis